MLDKYRQSGLKPILLDFLLSQEKELKSQIKATRLLEGWMARKIMTACGHDWK